MYGFSTKLRHSELCKRKPVNYTDQKMKNCTGNMIQTDNSHPERSIFFMFSVLFSAICVQ